MNTENTDIQEVDDYIKGSISKIDLFPFYRAFFDSKGVWEQLTDKAKMDNAFMIIRAISAKHPDYMQEMNKNHNVHLLDSLHRAFSKPNGKPPSWMYIKTKTRKVDNGLGKIDNDTIRSYIKINGIEPKMFDFVVQEYPEKVIKELKALQKDIDSSMKVKAKKK